MSIPIETEKLLGPLNDFERKHAPRELYLEGRKSLLQDGLRVSVVGSRKASENGVRRAQALVKALVEHGITVVSGLADGIDTVAHETAVALGGNTIAVLGTPLDKAYPAKNKDLLELIKHKHLAVSQFPMGYPANPKNFPQRNRTMALISDATIIVEASEKSGTRHQGWEAIRLGRLVYIMKNVADDTSLTWPAELIAYGAQVLTRDDMPDVLYDIPSFTAGVESAF
ncbi:DNA-processing protein DprA [Roseibium polysiphoniae]|uniref:DNA-protecting protein DprA n=1 Tax=Roseibium polysiphoniae TaxID=2571221 RepID=A0ABR9CCR3_9HYPH|nr:DNA-processing protein DprA [Roseibium polysiphoniae]MBD8877677.1 DNA-protecting protein DprA [Roseibium polysiphoniae]